MEHIHVRNLATTRPLNMMENSAREAWRVKQRHVPRQTIVQVSVVFCFFLDSFRLYIHVP